MSSTTVNATTPFLQATLRRIGESEIQLPDFQRDWVWKDGQISSLLASVSMGIPIGPLLTLEADGTLDPRTFEGVTQPTPPVQPKLLILDGQQRLTALFQACHSQQYVKTVTPKREINRLYYFDMKKCIDEKMDREDCVCSETSEALQPITEQAQYDKDLFPTNQVFNYRAWREKYLVHHQRDTEKQHLADAFEDAVVSNFRSYLIPDIRMEGTDLDTIAMTFEKTNDRGTRLGAFDIMTAKMKREDLNLKDDWHQQSAAIHAEPVLDRVDATHYLKAITIVVTKAENPSISARRKDMLSLKRDQYLKYRSAVTKGYVAAAKQLNEFGIIKPSQLVYVPHTIVMAAMYAHCDSQQANNVNAREVLKRWYWTTLLNESYGSRVTDQQIVADFSYLTDRLTNPNQTDDEAFTGSRFNSARLLSDRQNSLSTAVQALLAKEKHSLDWITGSPMETKPDDDVELHHIFPKKWCTDNGIGKGPRESVTNLTLIDAATNKIIGSKAPSVYLKDLQERAGNIGDKKMDEILESHLIPAKELRANDFEGFHRKRAADLKGLITEIIGPDRVA